MADVRSMLRAERANRRITHPNASYTTDGKLLCNLCESVVKSETAWQSHLHSTGHTLRSSRAQEAAAVRGNDASRKKRKASSLESPDAEDRKRAKPAVAATDEQDGIDSLAATATEASETILTDEVSIAAPSTNGSAQPPAPMEESASVDEDELAAFERDLAQLESTEAPTTALKANATISAAPMTAEQLAAQAREEQSAQRGKRDVEIEAEKEDAARLLEDEFEEMEGLEERVRRLRDRREALRKGSNASERAEVAEGLAMSVDANGHAMGGEEDDEDEDEFDEWAFGGS